MNNTEYKREYDEIALKKLSKPLKETFYLCSVFNCTKKTLTSWISKNPTFATSIELGLIHGEQKLRELLALNAFLPSTGVNTKLLTLMGNNVYGIKDNSETPIVNNTNITISSDADPIDAANLYKQLLKGDDTE